MLSIVKATYLLLVIQYCTAMPYFLEMEGIEEESAKLSHTIKKEIAHPLLENDHTVFDFKVEEEDLNKLVKLRITAINLYKGVEKLAEYKRKKTKESIEKVLKTNIELLQHVINERTLDAIKKVIEWNRKIIAKNTNQDLIRWINFDKKALKNALLLDCFVTKMEKVGDGAPPEDKNEYIKLIVALKKHSNELKVLNKDMLQVIYREEMDKTATEMDLMRKKNLEKKSMIKAVESKAIDPLLSAAKLLDAAVPGMLKDMQDTYAANLKRFEDRKVELAQEEANLKKESENLEKIAGEFKKFSAVLNPPTIRFSSYLPKPSVLEDFASSLLKEAFLKSLTLQTENFNRIYKKDMLL